MARLKCPCLQVSRQMPGCYHNGAPSSGAGRLLLAKKLHNAKIVHNFELCVLHRMCGKCCTECAAGRCARLGVQLATARTPRRHFRSRAHQAFSVQCTTLSALHYIARKCTLSAFSVNKLQVFSVCCILCTKLRTVCTFCLHISAS